MSQAKRDQNRVPALIAVSSVDSSTPLVIEGDPTTKGLNVNIVGDDASIGGGTQYAVNAALGAAPTGTLALAKRDDALSALTPVEGDAIELRVDGEGALWVIPSGTTTVDGTVSSNATLQTGSATVGEVTIGAATGAAGDLAKIEDATHASGDVGVMALAVENEDQADLSTGDKDYTPIAVTKEGNVIVKQEGTIAVTESSPISGFATSAKQLADGHNVTVDNSTGGSAVNIQDGGNSITVDVPNQAYSYDYIAAPGADEITKGSAGFLHAILVGDAVASAIIEVSDDASDGDGNVVIYLAGDTLGPALYPVNMTMSTGITSDITNQTHVTMIYR